MELVMCVRSVDVATVFPSDGLWDSAAEDLRWLLSPERLWFVPRGIAEVSEEFRQLIPYIVLELSGKVVSYERTMRGAESRLHGLISIGFGGHVGLQDVVVVDKLDAWKTLTKAATREVNEEIGHCLPDSVSTIGAIVDNSTEVSRVHLGIAQHWRIPTMDVAGVEDAIGNCSLTPAESLASTELESWSRMCLSHLFPGLTATTPSLS